MDSLHFTVYACVHHRLSSIQAIVAIARKLLVGLAVGEGFGEDVPHADEDMVAFKLMMWAWKLRRVGCGGLTTPQFVRAGLMRLQMGEDLTHIIRGGQVRPIAPDNSISLSLRPQRNIT